MSWRWRLRPAFFRGVPFHVDESAIAGGRRVVPHDYPKRDIGYAEDMGRRSRGYRIRGYIIGPDFDLQGRLLIAALEIGGASILVLPLIGEDIVLCTSFSYNESREQGGYATLDMDFIPAGSPPMAASLADTGSEVSSAADAAKASIASSPMAGVASP